MYARDISRNAGSSHRLRGNAGEPLSQPAYGYLESPENKKKWIVYPVASQVVKDIFRMCLEGKGIETVAMLYEKLYENNASGKATDEWFMQLSHKYAVERTELKSRISELRERLNSIGTMQPKQGAIYSGGKAVYGDGNADSAVITGTD